MWHPERQYQSLPLEADHPHENFHNNDEDLAVFFYNSANLRSNGPGAVAPFLEFSNNSILQAGQDYASLLSTLAYFQQAPNASYQSAGMMNNSSSGMLHQSMELAFVPLSAAEMQHYYTHDPSAVSDPGNLWENSQFTYDNEAYLNFGGASAQPQSSFPVQDNNSIFDRPNNAWHHAQDETNTAPMATLGSAPVLTSTSYSMNHQAQQAVHNNIPDVHNPLLFQCGVHNCDLKFDGPTNRRNHLDHDHEDLKPWKCFCAGCQYFNWSVNNLQSYLTKCHREKLTDIQTSEINVSALRQGYEQIYGIIGGIGLFGIGYLLGIRFNCLWFSNEVFTDVWYCIGSSGFLIRMSEFFVYKEDDFL
ncbi:hypothetical protein FPQ18DRAFT_307866 [Pyronema domesticum]|nr:hypothetical protein FPQ18DRAFT_307866 [Pyronema domesticum]